MSSYTSSLNTTTVSLTNSNKIDSLMSGVKWGGAIGSGMSLSYSFPWTTNQTSYWQSGYPNEPYATYHFGLSTAQQEAVSSALQSWANVANLNFTQINESGAEVGDFRFAFSSEVPADVWGWCYYPDNYWATSADVWINNDIYSSDFSIGAYSYLSLIHEIGHGLGLKHPGNYNVGSTDPEQGPFLPADQDNMLYTIMSYYDSDINMWFDTQTITAKVVNPQTPMVFDIAAVQYLYGANNDYHSGDDVYTFDDMAPFLMTLWDGGGHDTISEALSPRACLIDLTPGHYSNIQTSRIVDQNEIIANNDTINVNGHNYTVHFSNPDNSASYNLGIAYGAIIEDAIGGSANDRLIGNIADNLLDGGTGDDQLTGEEGNNTLIGGLGTDTAIYTENRNKVTISTQSDGTYTLSHGGYQDTLNGVERLSFNDGSMGIDFAIGLYDKQAEISRFYNALFERDPDEEGLAFWTNSLVSGSTIGVVAQEFARSAEFENRYGSNISNSTFINLMYQNILHRSADQEGYDFWIDVINQNNNRGEMIVNFSNSIEYIAETRESVDAFLANITLSNYLLA